jgi:fluoroacetyl-CoA thioesterase
MKNNINLGDKKTIRVMVAEKDTATFDSGVVHPFYATFALARDAEWCGRLFVLDVVEEDEEGIGTFVHIEHLSPALLGEEVQFIAELMELNGNEVVCQVDAFVGSRQIARCKTGQKVLKRKRIEAIKEAIQSGKEKTTRE